MFLRLRETMLRDLVQLNKILEPGASFFYPQNSSWNGSLWTFSF